MPEGLYSFMGYAKSGKQFIKNGLNGGDFIGLPGVSAAEDQASVYVAALGAVKC